MFLSMNILNYLINVFMDDVLPVILFTHDVDLSKILKLLITLDFES